MIFTQSLTTNHPTGDTDPRDLDTIIRDQVKAAFRERLNVDHDFTVNGTTVDGDDVGKHRKVSFSVAQSTPDVPNGRSVIYAKLAADGQMELYFKNYNDPEVKLTTDGLINITPEALAGLLDNVTIGQYDGKLYIKDGSITATKLNANVRDDSSITVNGEGKLCIKNGGVGNAQLADGSVSRSKLGIPAQGGGALMTGIPIMATGNYTGDGTTGRVIEAFGTGVITRHVTIARNANEKVEAFIWNPSTGEQCAWDQPTNSEYASDAVSFSNNRFIVGGTHTNNLGSYYYWVAYGTWTV
jgi:hypothetical protein